MKYWWFITIIIVNTGLSDAQKSDSLYLTWQDKNLSDTIRLDALRQLTSQVRRSDPDSAVKLGLLLLKSAKSGNHRKRVYDAFTSLGISYAYLGNYKEAASNFKKGLEVAEEINFTKGALNSRVNLGGIYYRQSLYDSALKMFVESIEEATLIKDTVALISASNNLANIYLQKGILDTALTIYQNNLSLAISIGRKPDQAMAYGNIGMILTDQGRYIEALEYYLKSRDLKEELEDDYGLANDLNSIGSLFFILEDYDKALEYWQRHHSMVKNMGDKNAISISLENMAALFMARNNFDKAMDYAREGLKICEEIGNKAGMGSAHFRIAEIYKNKNMIVEAKDQYEKSMQFYRELNMKSSLASIYVNLGNIFLAEMAYEEALDLCFEAYESAHQEGYLEVLKESCKCLSDAWKGLENHENAYHYQSLFIQYRDSLFNEAKTKEITRLELNYAFEKEKKADSIMYATEKTLIENKLQREKNIKIILILAGLGGLLVLSLIGFFIWRSEEQKRKIKLQEKELQSEREIVERLQQIDQLKDQFLANTSHELKTPLSGIISLSESLMDGIAGKLPDSAIQNLKLISSSGKRLAGLVNDILDFSKLKNREIRLNLRSVDLYSIVDVILMVFRPLSSDKNIVLTNQIPRDLPRVQADENRLQQIFYNLIGNALKFSESGEIKVEAVKNGDFVSVSVSDTGIGIPEDKIDTIFNAFEQLDAGDERQYEGTGIGLTITRQLVELHGGNIQVSSIPGEGSTFIFTIPVSDQQKIESEQPSLGTVDGLQKDINKMEVATGMDSGDMAQPYVIPENNSARILIIDDEIVIRQALKNQLIMKGYEVCEAVNGMEALEKLEQEDLPDLVLLDIMMPKMSGYEVCEKIRSKYRPDILPVILLTAKNRITDLVQGLDSGANDFISKPFLKEELLSRIRTHLNIKKINSITNKFVPGEFLKSIGHQSIAEVKLGDHIEKEFTVFFSDIRNYTSLSEKMQPRENFNFINEYVGSMGPLIHQNKGFVHQYLGDAIIAIFPNQSEKALTACIEMQKKIRENNINNRNNNREEIHVGMGLHTGQLIMGVIGDQYRNDPATVSDTVNVASRIEGITKFFGASIIISENTYDNINDPSVFKFRFLGKVQLKGKRISMGVYECFDGDDPDVIQGKKDTLDQFTKALDFYFVKEFSEAAVLFDRIIKQNPGDKVACYFRQKAAQYTAEGTPTDWDGIEKLMDK